jgi:hypothetical protein
VRKVLPHGSSLTIAGCGKTQLAHTMAVIAQLPKVKSFQLFVNHTAY